MALVKEDGRCFVCGPLNLQGLQAVFSLNPELGQAQCRLRIPSTFQGWQGVVHGGILATLLDEACMYACRTLCDQLVTAELTVRYLKPVPVGVEVEVTGTVIENQRRLFWARACILLDGVPMAEAEAKVFRLRAAAGAPS